MEEHKPFVVRAREAYRKFMDDLRQAMAQGPVDQIRIFLVTRVGMLSQTGDYLYYNGENALSGAECGLVIAGSGALLETLCSASIWRRGLRMKAGQQQRLLVLAIAELLLVKRLTVPAMDQVFMPIDRVPVAAAS